MSADVLVAGGGPVGLMTAALLDAAGIDVEVFERNPGPSEHSKATTMHPRTLETLDVLENDDGSRLSDVLVSRGIRAPAAHFALLPQRLDYTGLDTPYPFVLVVPQTTTERVLAEHLHQRGVPVHYGREVTGVEQDADAARVLVGDVAHECRFVVGADGAHSPVRKEAGIDFPGSPPTAVGFGADVEVTDPPTEQISVWRRDAGFMMFMPMPDRYRVFGIEPHDAGLTSEQARNRQAEPVELDEVRRAMHRILGTDYGLRGATWLYRNSDSTRHAAQYRSGRVLLAGDAAHVHLPAGGQGLNVGLQDAANLAWKLAAQLRGWAPRALVDGAFGYDHERRRVAEMLADNTLAQGALMNTFTPAVEALRGMIGDLVARDGETADEMRSWLSGLGVHYPAPDGSHPLTGTRAPDVEGLFRALRPDRYLLADLTGEHAALDTDRVEVRRIGSPPATWAEAGAVLVRPDGYVATAVPPGATPDLDEWIAT